MFKKYQTTLFWLAIGAVILLSIGRFVVRAANDRPDLIINEFVATNATGLTDEEGDTSDWIELYNPGSTAVNLSGWALTAPKDLGDFGRMTE